MTWHLGILTDRAGHVHLGAVVAGSAYRARDYIELLAPVGAASPAELDLQHLVVLVHGRHIADLRRLVERCIDDDRLRQRLAELIDLSAVPAWRGGMGSLSTVGAAGWSGTAPTARIDALGSRDAALWPAEASDQAADQDGSSGPCVVCGQRTTRTVRPMGWITDPIWCCHEHKDRSIIRAWIHQLPEFRQVRAEYLSACRTCSGPCHCEGLTHPRGHPCDCWPPRPVPRGPATGLVPPGWR